MDRRGAHHSAVPQAPFSYLKEAAVKQSIVEVDQLTSHAQHPRTQARAHRTRAAILAAASTQFDVLGYAETSIRTIIASGELTKGAIYFHFSSKEAIAHQLVAAWNQSVSESINEAMIVGSASTKVEQLRAIFTSLAHQVDADTRLRAGMKLTLEPSIGATAFTHWVEETYKIVENAVTAGELANHPVVRRLAWNLCTGTVGAAHAHTITPHNTDLVTRIDDTVAAHLSAAQLDRGEARTDPDSERSSCRHQSRTS